MKKLYVYDAYQHWSPSILAACAKKGYVFSELKRGTPIPTDGYVFVRPDMHPGRLAVEKMWLTTNMQNPDIKWITDPTQIKLYEDKAGQAEDLNIQVYLPGTTVCRTYEEAKALVRRVDYPLVSKAPYGASSQFVRIIPNELELLREAKAIFHGGLPLNTKKWPKQEGIAIYQEFIPDNDFTYRVNIVGQKAAMFIRHNYPNKPVAQTGNTDPVRQFTDDQIEALEFGLKVADGIDSRFVALDILRDGEVFYLLETSLAFPWPGVGEGALFYGTDIEWNKMWEVMLDEISAGAFD